MSQILEEHFIGSDLDIRIKQIGTFMGQKVTPDVISLDELYYNRPNWRDINKDKSLTREDAKELFNDVVENKSYFKYQVNKAKKFIKQKNEK